MIVSRQAIEFLVARFEMKPRDIPKELLSIFDFKQSRKSSLDSD